MEFNKAETEAQCVELPVCCICCELPIHTYIHWQRDRQTPTLTLNRVRSSYAMLSQIWRQIYFASQLLQQTLLFTSLSPSSLPRFSLILCSFLCCSLSDRFTVASLLAFCCFSWKLLLKITKLLVSFSLCHRLRLRFRVACQVSSASFLLASFSLNSALPLCSVAVELFLLFVLVMARPPPRSVPMLALDFPARIEIETPRSAIVFICPAKWHNRSSPAPFACLPLPPSSRSQLTGSFVVPRFSTRCQLQKEQTNKQNYVHKRNPHLAYYSRHAPQKGPHK